MSTSSGNIGLEINSSSQAQNVKQLKIYHTFNNPTIISSNNLLEQLRASASDHNLRSLGERVDQTTLLNATGDYAYMYEEEQTKQFMENIRNSLRSEEEGTRSKLLGEALTEIKSLKGKNDMLTKEIIEIKKRKQPKEKTHLVELETNIEINSLKIEHTKLKFKCSELEESIKFLKENAKGVSVLLSKFYNIQLGNLFLEFCESNNVMENLKNRYPNTDIKSIGHLFAQLVKKENKDLYSWAHDYFTDILGYPFEAVLSWSKLILKRNISAHQIDKQLCEAAVDSPHEQSSQTFSRALLPNL